MKVTDPALLAQLNAPSAQGAAGDFVFDQDADAPVRKKVVDPQILAQLNATPPRETPEGTSIGRTAFDQGMQGATYGFSDEVSNPLGVAMAAFTENPTGFLKSVFTGNTPEVSPELNAEIAGVKDASKQRLAAQMQEHPVISIGSQLAGGLMTGAAGASTKAGSAIANSLRGGGLGARIAKGAMAGAASGGLFGAGTADEGNRLEGAQNGAIVGGLAGAALPAVGAAVSGTVKGTKNAIQGISARAPEELQQTLEAMRDTASGYYNQMRQIGASLKPQAANDMVNKIKSELAKQQMLPSLNPKTLGVVNDLDDIVAQAATGGQLQVNTLDQLRRQLGRIGATEDGVSAAAVKRVIDDTLSNLKPADLTNGGAQAIQLLNKARKASQQAFKFSDIADVIAKAGGDPTRLKNGLKKFLESHNYKPPGYNLAEITALKQAATSSSMDKIARALGTFGFDFGKVKNVALPTLASGGAYAAPSIGAPLVAAGTVARQGRKLVASGQAENLLKAIENFSAGAAQPAPAAQLPYYISPSLLAGQLANLKVVP